MKRLIVVAAGCLFAPLTAASAQSLDDLNIQFHGFATQGFLYTTKNNILTTTSSDGSPDWDEAVVNVSAQPTNKLRIAFQTRYELLGNYFNGISIDYALGDYRVNDHLGVRFGKVKVPSGLFNEIQDIDPSYLWALLPQSIYDLPNRDGLLSVYGGSTYGTWNFDKMGKLDYRGWGGAIQLPKTDGFFLESGEQGVILPNGQGGVSTGAALHWRTPLAGLMVGASDIRYNANSSLLTVANGAVQGTFYLGHYNLPQFFAHYEKNRIMLAGEYAREPVNFTIELPGPPSSPNYSDKRSMYGMASYKITDKLNAGLYYSQKFDLRVPLGPARYQKDWALAARYDFDQYIYAKVEQHFLDGTYLNYDTDLNAGGLQPSTRLTILKMGVSF